MSTFEEQIQHKIDTKTKPLGALGKLEAIAKQVATIQQSLTPQLKQPTILTFAGDHGAAKAGVSAFPQEVTFQMVMNFLNGGAAINAFCQQNQITLHVVDAGVNFDFEAAPGLIDAKVAHGTASYITGTAMTEAQLQDCFDKSAAIVADVAKDGCNVIGFGEMGIGNTASSSLIMSAMCQLPIERCVGRGTGLDDEGMHHKTDLLTQVQALHGDITDPRLVMQTYGGFEIAQMCGAMLAAQKHGMIVMVDGFIATAAYLVAVAINPALKDHAIFCHTSGEAGHQLMLDHLKVEPLVNLGMRLGEGTGCAVAYPLIQSAVAFLNDMASFESAGVSESDAT
ncbi:nicotinate-nucleotide--dimethylbenzimidazole phosphoribosyltransferase [Leucothrix pacifica]|uniref:Nicotinate-nucleotide--dimethylbenzimidazole phosphoribosyltransferase n=1 Tax=Leucothrix pacifica TaxID=1247513 RepID=A0A317CFS1_9GAMM|nr:nicotinate-nucleotide--dimethylbenzimidazole phosphoribosyltransferase [Leucothrix pacifica]PWQ97395.1 nicotinate-nucleotide--dimethylbenzimidazole phosphoribosyltransferase [Leucothrix pacifica]